MPMRILTDSKATHKLILFSLLLAALTLQVIGAGGHHFWADETYSISRAIDHPFLEYLKGNTLEGNTSPIYFVLIKILLLIQPHLPIDPVLLLRLVSVIPAWLALGFLVYWTYKSALSKKFGWIIAAGTGFLFFSHPAFQHYQWQCRPYGLWILFSTIHMCFVADHLRGRPKSNLQWFFLAALLCSTISIGLLQLAAGFGVLLLSHGPSRHLVQAGAVTVPWMVASLAWRSGLTDTYAYTWPGWMETRHLLLSNIRLKATLPLLLLPLMCRPNIKDLAKSHLYLFFMLLVAVLILLVLRSTANSDNSGFIIPARYFLFLFPAVIGAIVHFWLDKKSIILASVYASACIAVGSYFWLTESKHDLLGSRNHSHPAAMALKSLGESCACLLPPVTESFDPHFWVEISLELKRKNQSRDCEGKFKPLDLIVDRSFNSALPFRVELNQADKSHSRIDGLSMCL